MRYRNGKLDSTSYFTRNDILREAARAICDFCRVNGDPHDCADDLDYDARFIRFVHPLPGEDPAVCAAEQIWLLIKADPIPTSPRKHQLQGWMLEAAQRILRKLGHDFILGVRGEDAVAHIIANSFYDPRTAEEMERARS